MSKLKMLLILIKIRLLIQHKAAYIFTLGLHQYQNSFVDINQVIAWLRVSAELALHSIVIDGVSLASLGYCATDVEITDLLDRNKDYDCGIIEGMPRYIDIRTGKNGYKSSQVVSVDQRNNWLYSGVRKTRYSLRGLSPHQQKLGEVRSNIFTEEGVQVRKQFNGNINPVSIETNIKRVFVHLNVPVTLSTSPHMYRNGWYQGNNRSTILDLLRRCTEIANTGHDINTIETLLVTPDNNPFYNAINTILANNPSSCGIIASI